MLDKSVQEISSLLSGKTFISTRPVGRAKELANLISLYKGSLLEFPMIKLKAVCSDTLNNEFENLTSYSHVIFTSVHAFEFFIAKLKELGISKEVLGGIKVASIGYKTTEVISDFGLTIDFDAKAKTGEEFSTKFLNYIKNQNVSVLWPTGQLSPNHLVESVQKVGVIKRLDIYENSRPNDYNEELLGKIKSKEYDMIILASPSAFNNLYSIVESDNLKVVCIGDTTAKSVEKRGVKPLAIAQEPSAKGILNAILDYYQKETRK